MNHDVRDGGPSLLSRAWPSGIRNIARRFGILRIVHISNGRLFFRIILISSATALLVWAPIFLSSAKSPQQPASGVAVIVQQSGSPIATPPYPTIPAPVPQRTGLNIVVIDPAHGGTDPGARGAQGIRESDLVLDLTVQVRRALEAQGFQVLQTRSDAQRGTVFVTLHIASTGLPGTARVYTMPESAATVPTGGVLSWDHAQAPYITLSRKFGDAVQGQLAQRFKGSPNNAQSAAIRQLRTTGAPAIAVEICSVSVQDRGDLDRMMPGVADAIARGLATFRPSYVLPGEPGSQP